MKVSVIVPVYNGEKYLGECLDSILAQSHSDIELIVVDDGSTDASGTIGDTYARCDSRVRVLHQTNGGPGAARNTGIDAATGSWLCFVDADDMLHPRAVELLLDAATRCDAQIACAGYMRAYEPDFGTVDITRCRVVDSLNAIEQVLHQRFGMLNSSVCGQLYDARIMAQGLRFDETILYEDLDFFYRIYELARRVVGLNVILYFYRDTPMSIINTWNSRRLAVLDVTGRIENHFAASPRLLAAARDRRMSAAFNIFAMNARHTRDTAVAARCWQLIRERRAGAMTGRGTRLKNRIGAAVSYLGPRLLSLIARHSRI